VHWHRNNENLNLRGLSHHNPTQKIQETTEMLNLPGQSACGPSLEDGRHNTILHWKKKSFMKKTTTKHYRPIEIFFIGNGKGCLSTTDNVIEVIQHRHVPTTQKIGT